MCIILSAIATACGDAPIMQPAVDRLTQALEAIDHQKPRIPVLSNVDARPHDDPVEIRNLLIRQVVQPVLWSDSMQWMIDEFHVDSCYEIGPGRVLRGLLKRISHKFPCQNVAVRFKILGFRKLDKWG